MLKGCKDCVVRLVQPNLKTGRKWKVVDAIGDAEKSLKAKEIMGVAQTGGAIPILSFMIRATYDLLPSNTSLVKWGMEDMSICPLCKDKSQSIDHVLRS
uniref:Reverse transcriptase zinc-binding domain-containing protein n=1 Tax=Octopus bimaculoides TaxID=37653 RepID=A0A0L8HZI1_OCTBM